MASFRVFYREHPSPDPWGTKNYADPCACRNGRTAQRTVEMRVGKPKPKDKAFVDQAGAKFKENITKAIEKLRLMLEEQQTSLSVVDEPALIASGASGS